MFPEVTQNEFQIGPLLLENNRVNLKTFYFIDLSETSFS